jgi:ATP-dependent DNA helicase RecQ
VPPPDAARYFGEQLPEPLRQLRHLPDPGETWDGTVAAQKALSCIYRTGQRSAPHT